MSISFYVKNKKKILGYEKVLNVESALTILDKELNVYNVLDTDINDLLLSPISNYECLLIGEDNVSGRGFELSYDNKNKSYAIRVFTPSTREDWLLALEYIKALAKKFNSEIVNERGEVYTVDNIDKFEYESDILYGIEVVSSNLKDEDIKVSIALLEPYIFSIILPSNETTLFIPKIIYLSISLSFIFNEIEFIPKSISLS